MKNDPLRRYDFYNPVKPGIIAELSNKTKVNRSAAFVFLTCPICEGEFERKASEAKRHNVSYCGRGCQGVANQRQVTKECVVCGSKYTVKKSMEGRITCCSPKCKSEKQAKLALTSELILRQNTKQGE